MVLSQIVLVLILIFGFLTISASNLKHAIILSAIVGLWASFAYLLYHAPDVAVSEAVVASTLGTILLVMTIRKYSDITLPPFRSLLRVRWCAALVLVICCALLVGYTLASPGDEFGPLRVAVMENYLASPQIVSPVTSILLNYRVFDTVLEACMLLIAVLAVVHLTGTSGGHAATSYPDINVAHPTLRTAIRVLMPLFIVIGVALVAGDPFTPGGGFQGGGVLAAVVVGRYLIRPYGGGRTSAMENLEKLIFIIFVLSIIAYVVLDLRSDTTYAPFMIAMNSLLGIKVFCGLSIMFLFFAAEE
jgi:multicomponent Na+:H+ antiporter subunit B